MNLRQKLRKYQFSGVGDKTALEFEIKGLRAESWYRYALLPQEEIRVFNKGEKELLLFDPAKIWEKVTVPVLAIWGKEDLLAVGRDRGVGGGHPAQLLEQFGLGESFGEINRPLQPNSGRNLHEQVVKGLDADRIQHLPDVLLGMGKIAHYITPPGAPG
jgi:hypothetical protein